MTVTEFSNEFDIAYNSIATNAAPGIDMYEKSVYLSKAQLELVKNYFNPKGNKYQSGFENDSKRRNDLSELIKNYSSSSTISPTTGISEESQFFTIPKNTFLIIQESAQVSSTNVCIDGSYIDVRPRTHDEFNVLIKNPFKRPNKDIIWRMDYSIQSGANKNVELISPYTIINYKMRYLQTPEPIVLVDLDTEFEGEGLSIDGIKTVQTCKLNESMHREILDRAVELALVDYKPTNAQLKTQVDLRNE